MRSSSVPRWKTGKDVVVVMHSYGGIVGHYRRIGGLKGGVTRLLYMCAFVVPVGASLTGQLGGQLPPFIKVEARTETFSPMKQFP